MPNKNLIAEKAAESLQFAALPYRIGRAASVDVLLITSRETARWIVPKGWPIEGKEPYETAAIEAFEEAGVVGKPKRRAIGSYEYWKRLESFSTLCRVDVYPLPIDHLEENWPEEPQRQRKLFDFETAASLVDEPSLQRLIASFGIAQKRQGPS